MLHVEVVTILYLNIFSDTSCVGYVDNRIFNFESSREFSHDMYITKYTGAVMILP